MSTWRTKENCPSCGEEFYGTVMQVVDFAEDPSLRKRLIDKEINFLVCPHCGTEMTSDFFLVRDPVTARIIFFIAKGKESAAGNSLLRNLLSVAFEDTKPWYKNPVSVDTWEELTQLIGEPS